MGRWKSEEYQELLEKVILHLVKATETNGHRLFIFFIMPSFSINYYNSRCVFLPKDNKGSIFYRSFFMCTLDESKMKGNLYFTLLMILLRWIFKVINVNKPVVTLTTNSVSKWLPVRHGNLVLKSFD